MSIAVLFVTSLVTIAENNEEDEKWDLLLAELKAIEDYVSWDESGDYPVQVFKADTALDNDISAETVALAGEMVAFQNKGIEHAFYSDKPDADEHPKAEVADYTKMDEFFDKVTEKLAEGDSETSARLGDHLNDTIRTLGIGKVLANNPDPDRDHPCGDWTDPVPDETPTRYTIDDWQNRTAYDYFNDNGYHYTEPYATNDGNVDGTDYTIWTSYWTGSQFCERPLFRNHGRGNVDDPYDYSVQYGEPNPEVLNYIPDWPYWNWYCYVRWWHDNF